MVRYGDYFQANQEFFNYSITRFFSDRGIKHNEKAIASNSLNQFLRLIEKYKGLPIFPPQAQNIASSVVALLEVCEA